MVVISRDDRQAACVSPNRLESSCVRHPVAGPPFDCMQAPLALHLRVLSFCRAAVDTRTAVWLDRGRRGGNVRHVIFAP